MQVIKLNDGNLLPAIGFGTYTLKGAAGVNAITNALENGNRLIDTAVNYENEGAVGAAIRRANISRVNLTVTSKLPGRNYQRNAAIQTIQESLYRTGLDYFDLYLLHWPNPQANQYVEAWQTLIDAQKYGLVRSIGVCNFEPEYLDRLAAETGVRPVVNQVELHPYFNQEKVRTYDQQHQIVTEAWSPLGRAGQVLKDPTLVAIARHHHKSVPQVILRWQLQLKVVPIPKSQDSQRQQANLAVFDFELSPEEMTKINQLTRPDGRSHDQDPRVYQEF